MNEREEKRVHDMIGFVGLRAHATAVGLLRLSAELVRAGVLDEAAMGRVKDAIVKDLSLSRSLHEPKEEFERLMRERLDALFAGEQDLGAGPIDEEAGAVAAH